ncbi:ANIS5 family metal-binding protein [Pedobacter africanus]|uniref:Prophage tail length tape measure protein n=1 Tax=Pedobacter africanus TaxID=151894 RepID=A0A1W1ZBR8_9SPHI|nr:hypothetical protein [Pedobacter africanus]SMC45712.1 hypothetical protein SAMN04488524_0561 [Pedobacter africanus]
MANEKLSIELTAKIDGLRDSFNQAIREVNSYDKETKAKLASVDKGFAQLANDIDKAMSSASVSTSKASSQITKSLAQAAQATAAGGKSIKSGSDQAANALTNLGRVAQDAPFGFIGIQNNLNPLLESFQRLKAETGSSGAALKALGQSLIGPAGIGIALSVVSSAIILYQQYQQRANKTIENAKKTTDDYINTLDQLSQVQLKGAQNAQRELTELASLYQISQDATISIRQRKDAVDELQSQYPAYFANIKDETILNGGAKEAYDRLTTAIIATARARAAQDLITKNSSKQLENEQKLIDLESDRVKKANELALAKKREAQNVGNSDIQTGSAADAIAAAKASQSLKGIIKEQGQIKAENNKLDQENLRLTEQITKEVKKGADLAGKVGDLKKVKIEAPKIGKLGTGGIFGDLGLKAFENINLSIITKPLKEIRTETEFAVAALKGNFDYTSQQIEDFVSKYGRSAVELLDIAQKFNSDFNQIAFGGITDTLSSLGSAIGESFANGSNILEAAGQSLLSSLGGILVEFGKLTLAAGVAATALGQALRNPLNPANAALAIGAGAALIAIGSAIKAFSGKVGKSNSSGGAGKTDSKSIPQFASGVQNFGGGLALVGERGPELVNLPTGSSVIPTGRTERMMRGSNSSVVVGGEMRISMRELVVALRREEKLLGRLG